MSGKNHEHEIKAFLFCDTARTVIYGRVFVVAFVLDDLYNQKSFEDMKNVYILNKSQELTGRIATLIL